MATASKTYDGSKETKKAADKILIWLDDSAKDSGEPYSYFKHIFKEVRPYRNHNQCLDHIRSISSGEQKLSVLVSGKYGEMLASRELQVLAQVEEIFVYCMDVEKHKKWADSCDKVRSVESDLERLLKIMQGMHPSSKKSKITHVSEESMDVDNPSSLNEFEYFTTESNFFDQIALQLVLNESYTDDGRGDFQSFCDTKNIKQKVDLHKINEFCKPELDYMKINSTDSLKLWQLRWFLRSLHKELSAGKDKISKKNSNFTVYSGIWLSEDERRYLTNEVGQNLMVTEFLWGYTDIDAAQKTLTKKPSNDKNVRVILEIQVDVSIDDTVPYGEIDKNVYLFWYGGRFRLRSIEDMSNDDSHRLFMGKLRLTSSINPALKKLTDYYLKSFKDCTDDKQAFGQLLISKGSYYDAQKLLENSDHYEELAEIALRRCQHKQADEYLQKVDDDLNKGRLLKAYFDILVKNNIGSARSSLKKLLGYTKNELIKVKADFSLACINLITTPDDQLVTDFKSANEVFLDILPKLHPDESKSLIGLGYAYYSKKQFEDAQKCFEKALEQQKQVLPKYHPDLAKTYAALAHCYALSSNKRRDAQAYLEQAEDILIRTYRDAAKNHPELKATKSEMEFFLQRKPLPERRSLLDFI